MPGQTLFYIGRASSIQISISTPQNVNVLHKYKIGLATKSGLPDEARLTKVRTNW
ncbi:hypothetical protein IMPR6_180058 [Imperialibacter sp. EC-SDR9]|nr:hypothetical protein IMPERIA89_300056 [Imperialibacter sp. 89]CAD5269790.1 hypothetical protein IMPERIA75_360056 [Imperialibacter sp. 75]VVT09408.1 hypothetical protein IMPR6_180058 [Imperialibacter sp. EC-SDR9]